MSTVDEILATHRYSDRRGRIFRQTRDQMGFCEEWIQVWPKKENGYRHAFVTEAQMRLLIERDQHRDVCRGLRHCGTHPVPAVVSWTTPIGFPQYGAHWRGRHHYTSTLPEAMDAARALAVRDV